ncbi:MAG: VOC family protein, partial [Pseudomonadota bacterium]
SLSVTDIQKSKAFYAALGFSDLGGAPDADWCIMKNGDAIIGLFQGMFEGNILTFNPGWDNSAQEVDDWTDIRKMQQQLKAAGVEFETEVDEDSSGPGPRDEGPAR